MGEEGFASDLLYHRYIPSANKDTAPWDLPDQAPRLQPPLMSRHLKMHELFGKEWKTKNVVTGRRLVLGNEDVRIS